MGAPIQEVERTGGVMAWSAQRRDANAVIDEVTRLLHDRAERMTGPRRAVLSVLATHSGHVLAEDVVRAVAERDPSVHRASVYRTLEALTEVGVLQHVHVGHGATAYHLVDDQGPHLHAQCVCCGTMQDLPLDLLDGVAGHLSRGHGFTLYASHVALSGICRSCSSAEPGTRP